MNRTTEIPTDAYPLTWPVAQPRTKWRKASAFKALGFGRIRDEMLDELRRLGGTGIVVSSNIPTRLDGLPYAAAREPDDPGVAVYFKRKGKPYVIACDTFDRAWKNLRAISGTVEALRAIERYGASSMLEQAFQGFSALPAHAAEPSWWDVLGVHPHADTVLIRQRYHDLAHLNHPDRGGKHEEMARINRAFEAAMQERGEA